MVEFVTDWWMNRIEPRRINSCCYSTVTWTCVWRLRAKLTENGWLLIETHMHRTRIWSRWSWSHVRCTRTARRFRARDDLHFPVERALTVGTSWCKFTRQLCDFFKRIALHQTEEIYKSKEFRSHERIKSFRTNYFNAERKRQFSNR